MDVAEDAEAVLDPRIQVRFAGEVPRLAHGPPVSLPRDPRPSRFRLCPFVAVAVPNTAWYIVPLCFHFPSFARIDVPRESKMRAITSNSIAFVFYR